MGFIAGSRGGGNRPQAARQYTPAPRPGRGGTVPATPCRGPRPALCECVRRATERRPRT